ncbi:FHA domain-containing protein [Desulfoluna sp.]|uniref:FHA domain-containing protein n=1 Tax=Desulfoluna sp. TaxID=2045199 RepID=UPI00260396E5|nr:FHA domain-containing protein [Desulfoluna sp.]
MPFLILKYQGKMIRQYALEYGYPLSIGRNEKNDVIIGNLAVSGFHARVEFREDSVVVSDLESKNGTYVNGKRVSKAVLGNGDELGVGKHQLLFSENRADVTFHETPLTALRAGSLDVTMALDMSDLKNGQQRSVKGLSKKPLPILVFKKGGRGRIELGNRYTRMGSARSNEVVVKGFLVGKRAATVVRRDDGYYLNHVSGLIKPRLNGVKVGKEPVKLSHGDTVTLGKSNLRFLSKVRMRKVDGENQPSNGEVPSASLA